MPLSIYETSTSCWAIVASWKCQQNCCEELVSTVIAVVFFHHQQCRALSLESVLVKGYFTAVRNASMIFRRSEHQRIKFQRWRQVKLPEDEPVCKTHGWKQVRGDLTRQESPIKPSSASSSSKMGNICLGGGCCNPDSNSRPRTHRGKPLEKPFTDPSPGNNTSRAQSPSLLKAPWSIMSLRVFL